VNVDVDSAPESLVGVDVGIVADITFFTSVQEQR
jgi:hypothetical protein